MSDQNKELATQQNRKVTLKDKAVVTTGLLMGASAPAMANIDVSEGVTQLGLAIAAIGALGAAKLAPSAIMWVWGMVTSGARRG